MLLFLINMHVCPSVRVVWDLDTWQLLIDGVYIFIFHSGSLAFAKWKLAHYLLTLLVVWFLFVERIGSIKALRWNLAELWALLAFQSFILGWLCTWFHDSLFLHLVFYCLGYVFIFVYIVDVVFFAWKVERDTSTRNTRLVTLVFLVLFLFLKVLGMS